MSFQSLPHGSSPLAWQRLAAGDSSVRAATPLASHSPWLAPTEKGATHMIEVTRLNNTKLLINSDQIEFVEETPDTVISFLSGKKIIVKESRQEIQNLVILYRKKILKDCLIFRDQPTSQQTPAGPHDPQQA